MFVDFKKVFDSIDFNIIVKILRRYGFPEPITDAIRLLYDGTCSALKINGAATEKFGANTGVLQRDV